MSGDQAKSHASPFHAGEVELQRHVGAAERMAAVGRKVVRDFMPDQHRDFVAQLPFIVMGTVDREGDAWATLAEGDSGFVVSPDPKTLRISARRDGADPADSGLGDGADVGLLGIELHTRRRNRMNGRLRREDADSFAVSVEQSFGNCPKYIQLRDFSFAEAGEHARPAATELSRLDQRAREMIQTADTLFVGSYVDVAAGRRQVDVSHRGGKPGFVRIDECGHLTIPDFAGNHFFNTLGNILATGRAGLLFIDFKNGDLLQLTGDAEVILDSPEIAAFEGCERAWTVRPRRIVFRAGATRLRWHANGEWLSPFSRKTGSWHEPKMPLTDAGANFNPRYL